MKLKLTVCLIFIIVVSSCEKTQVKVPQISVPFERLQQADQRAAGKRLFQRHCSQCHGTTAEGRNPRAARFTPLAPDFLSHSYLAVAPAYLYWRIAEGKRTEPFRSQGSVMPAWKPYFSEQQIWQLVAYLRQRAGDD